MLLDFVVFLLITPSSKKSILLLLSSQTDVLTRVSWDLHSGRGGAEDDILKSSRQPARNQLLLDHPGAGQARFGGEDRAKGTQDGVGEHQKD